MTEAEAFDAGWLKLTIELHAHHLTILGLRRKVGFDVPYEALYTRAAQDSQRAMQRAKAAAKKKNKLGD